MRASGATEDDRRDRGNYAPGSQVMNQTYDYATGLGPLAANSLPGGYQPSIADVQRLLPAKRGSVAPVQDVMPMVYAGIEIPSVSLPGPSQFLEETDKGVTSWNHLTRERSH